MDEQQKRDREQAKFAKSGLIDAWRYINPAVRFAGELEETPERFARAMREMTRGYFEEPAEHLKRTFRSDSDEVVVVRDIPFASLCEHHMLPFSGVVSVAYIPNGLIVGLSKIPRMVRGFAARLQVQERLTSEIGAAMNSALNPKGVAVHIRAAHTCMQLRGARAHGEMITSAMLGVFRTDPSARAEALTLIGVGR